MTSNTAQYIGQFIKRSGLSRFWKRMSQSHTSGIEKKCLVQQHCSLLPKNLQWLLNDAPAFPIHGSQVQFLNHSHFIFTLFLSAINLLNNQFLYKVH